MTTSGHMKGVAMNKPICGHIYPDGNGGPMTKPDGDGCRAVDTSTVRSVDTSIWATKGSMVLP